MFGFVVSEVWRKVDFLIGINYFCFYVGEIKVNVSLVVCRSLFGWVIFGFNVEDVMLEIK